MKGTVFYSWQSDTDKEVCCEFIGEALKKALCGLSEPLDYDEATRGEAGSPPIFPLIQQKIAKATLFVADLTVVERFMVTGNRTKCSPNPNVLMEYGFALRGLGHQRIVLLLNEHFGSREQLPFDVLGHPPLVRAYSLGPNAQADEREKVGTKVVKQLHEALQCCIDAGIWSNLSETARLTIGLFIGESKHGISDPEYRFPAFRLRTGLSERDAEAVLDELEMHGLIKQKPAIGHRVYAVSPRSEMFWKYDRFFNEWNVEDDAKSLAKRLVENDQVSCQKLAEEFGWPPQRINPALTFLAEHQHVAHSETISQRYAFFSILETPNTRRFANDDP